MVYFIQASVQMLAGIDVAWRGPVKIGTCRRDAYKRLLTLQVGCPLPLSLLGTIEGGEAEEAALHSRFVYERGSGEWFDLSSGFRDYLLSLGFDPGPPMAGKSFHSRRKRRTGTV